MSEAQTKKLGRLGPAALVICTELVLLMKEVRVLESTYDVEYGGFMPPRGQEIREIVVVESFTEFYQVFECSNMWRHPIGCSKYNDIQIRQMLGYLNSSSYAIRFGCIR